MDTLTYSALIGGAKNFSTEEKIPTEKPSTFWTGKIIEIQWGLPFESFRFDQPFGRRISFLKRGREEEMEYSPDWVWTLLDSASNYPL